jgi:hypothetical protein
LQYFLQFQYSAHSSHSIVPGPKSMELQLIIQKKAKS